MTKVTHFFFPTIIASIALTLVGCGDSAQKDATPNPTPEPTASATPLPTTTPSPTATPVTVLTTPLPVVAPAASAAPAASVPPLPSVTDPVVLSGELNAPTFVGRSAELTGLKVEWLVGDRAFYVVVGDSNRRMLVVLDTKLNKGPADANLVIVPKETLTVHGVLEKLPGEQEIADKWGVRGKEAEPLKGEVIYLHANQVTVTQGPGAK